MFVGYYSRYRCKFNMFAYYKVEIVFHIYLDVYITNFFSTTIINIRLLINSN